MPRITIGDVVKCENGFVDDCWQLTTQLLDEEIVAPEKVCWGISATDATSGENACWTVTGNDRCGQNEEEFTFEKDIDLEKHGIFKVFAIHINYSTVYMAVLMREPDNPTAETYTDNFASSVTRLPSIMVGGREVEQWEYKPTYKATEIVNCYDVFGNLTYWVVEDDYGYKSIIRDSFDPVFTIDYKMDMGFRIIKGSFTSAWDVQSHFMNYIEKSFSLPEELIGNGCILMGRQELTIDPTIVFTAKNKASFRLADSIEDGFDIYPLDTVGLNYMLSNELAMTHESSSYYNIRKNAGYGKMYANAGKLQYDSYGMKKVVGIMHTIASGVSDYGDGVAGFRSGLKTPIAEDSTIKTFMHDIMYGWYHQGSAGIWGGSGQAGSIVGGDPWDGSGFGATSISGIPEEPIDITGDTVHVETRHGLVTGGGVGGNTFKGMFIGTWRGISEFSSYIIEADDLPQENRMRMDLADYVLHTRDYLAVMKSKLVWWKHDGYRYETHALEDSTKVMDFTVFVNDVIIADGTKSLKARRII